VADVRIRPADNESVFAAFDLTTKLRGREVDVEMLEPETTQRGVPGVRLPNAASVTAVIAVGDAEMARKVAAEIVDAATVMRSAYRTLDLRVVDAHGGALVDQRLHRDA